jgi:hypothetical protein
MAKKLFYILIPAILITTTAFKLSAVYNDYAEEQHRGCCSHHLGVCGCDASGRVRCCDGTLSPSCICR